MKNPPIVALEKRIQHLIDTNNVMVFSKTYCPYSAAAKKLLRSYTNDIEVLEVDLEDQSADIKKVLTKISHGHSTFPSIFFNGESIGGRDNLQALDNNGELKPRLESLGVSML
ncbi:thioredoxin-like protein [Dissophora ornata]|nr:thioredoxin-like protein [Dissophora ornata]